MQFDPSNLSDRVSSFSSKGRESFNRYSADATWLSAPFVCGFAGGGLGLVFGLVAGGIAGTIAGVAAIPAIAMMGGATIATALTAGTSLAGAGFWGLSLASWMGGLGGLMLGLGANYIRLTANRPVKTTSYKLDNKDLKFSNEDSKNAVIDLDTNTISFNGAIDDKSQTITLGLDEISRLKINEVDTTQCVRMKDYPKNLAATTGGLTGAFAGAVTGGVLGGALGTVALAGYGIYAGVRWAGDRLFLKPQ